MVSILQGKLKKDIARAFKGKLSKGVIRRNETSSLDDFGDPQVDSFTDYPFDGIRENFDAKYAAEAGIPDTDVMIMVILGTTKVIPNQSDLVFITVLDIKQAAFPFSTYGTMQGFWHQIRRVLKVDPAGATQNLQAYVINPPI
jgi:hypothetical protein